MGFFRGKSASITVTGTGGDADRALPMSEWALSTKAERVELSDLRRRAARFRAGTPVAELRLSGPLPDGDGGGLGLAEGRSYDVVLGLGDAGATPPAPTFAVRLLVESVSVRVNVRGAATVDVSGVVNSDFRQDTPAADDDPADDPDDAAYDAGGADYDKLEF